MIIPYLLALFFMLANPAFADGTTELRPSAQHSSSSLELTPDERAWLLSHKKIIVAFDDSVPPYSFKNQSGQFEGIAVDMLNTLSRRLGIAYQTYAGSSWPEIYTAATERRVDVVAAMVDRPERHAWFNFTHPYLTKSLVIMTHKSDQTIKSRGDLAGKKVAFVKGYSFAERIISRNRSIKPFAVKSMLSCLETVEQKKSDACITFIGTAQYLLSKHPLPNVKFSDFYERNTADESIAVRKDWPILAGILQKALDALSESEMNAIYFKWVPLETSIVQADTNLNSAPSKLLLNKDIGWTWRIFLPFLFTVLYLWLWLLLLQRYRRNTGKPKLEIQPSDQSFKQLQSDFERMILKRTTELNTSERKFRNLVENLNKDYFFYQRDRLGKMTYVSPSVAFVLGYMPEHFSSNFRNYLTNHIANNKIDTVLESCVQGIPCPPHQFELYDAQNKKRWIEIAETPVYDEYGNCIGVDGLVFDITQRKLEEERIIWLAFHDELTALPNRRQFTDRLQQAIPLSNRNCMPFAVLYLNLDNFRKIIEEIGHGAADYMLIEISKRLAKSIRESDVAARIGDSEFAVLLLETDLQASAIVAQKIIRNLYAPLTFGMKSVRVDAHIGIAMYPRHGSDSEKLLQYADASMYYAKKKRLGYSSVIEM